MVSQTRSKQRTASEQAVSVVNGHPEVTSQGTDDIPGSSTPGRMTPARVKVVKEYSSPASRSPLARQGQEQCSTPQASNLSGPPPSRTPELDRLNQSQLRARVTGAARQDLPPSPTHKDASVAEDVTEAARDGSEDRAYDSEEEGGNGDQSQPQHCSPPRSSNLLRIFGALLALSTAVLAPVLLHDACGAPTPILQRIPLLQTHLSASGFCSHPLSQSAVRYTQDFNTGIRARMSSAESLLHVWSLYNNLQQQLADTRGASVQLWQQHNPRSLFASFPSSDRLSRVAAQAWSNARVWCNSCYASAAAQFQAACNSTYSHLAKLLQTVTSMVGGDKGLASGPSTPLQPSFTSLFSLHSFRALLADGKRWSENATDFWAHVVLQTSHKAKGTGLVLTCRHTVECDSAASDVIATVAPASCLLQLHSTTYSTDTSAGDLQQLLSSFLTGGRTRRRAVRAHQHPPPQQQPGQRPPNPSTPQPLNPSTPQPPNPQPPNPPNPPTPQPLCPLASGCPHGVVLVRYVHMLSLRSLSVLNNALSESGNLQQAGTSIPTHRALYVFVFETATPTEGDESRYAALVKEHLLFAIESTQAEGSMDDTGRALLQAFRRRIDHIAPAREVPNAGLRPTPTGRE
ncbi:MAG: hypothetical protein WDW38_010992 [Sanguina aurantia]